MAGSVVGGGGGGGGGGAAALKPLIDALDKNSAAISSQSDKQGEAKLAKMMEDLSAALELMVSFITKLNDSIAGLKLGFSTLAGALNAAAKIQASQKPVKPLTAKQQTQAAKDQAKADAKVLAQDKNLAYKREKDDKAILAKQLAQDARIAAAIIKAQLKAQKTPPSEDQPVIPAPFAVDYGAPADLEKLDKQLQEAAEDFNGFISSVVSGLAKQKFDAKPKYQLGYNTPNKPFAVDPGTPEESAKLEEQLEKAMYSFNSSILKSKPGQLEDKTARLGGPPDRDGLGGPPDRGGLGGPPGGADALGYKMEEFGKAIVLTGAAITPISPVFIAVAAASKFLGTAFRVGTMVVKGLISAFSWLRSTVSALAKSAAVYAPAIAQMAEMALRDLSAVIGAAAAPIAAAFTPIVRAISDRLFPVTKDAGAAGGDVVKSFGPLIDGIMAILMPTMTFLIAVFRLLWAVIGPVIEVIGGLVQILGSLWGAIMVLFTVMVDWMMPAFELLGAALSFLAKALKMAADGIAWAFSWLIGPVDKKDRAKDAFDPASTVGLAAAQNAKMSSFQSMGESAAQNAFLTSTGARDPQADLAQDMLNKDLPNKWAMFLDAQGKPQPIVAAQRNNAGPANPGVPGVQAGGDWMVGAAMG